MGALSDIYIKTETLEKLYKTAALKQVKGVAIKISQQDETNEYGQNVSAYVSQSQEDREAKKPRFYVGNGRVLWTDGKITKAERVEQTQEAKESQAETDELPF